MREAVVSFGDDELAAMGIDELVALSRSAGLLDFEEIVCEGTGAVIQVEVESRLDEDRLEALDYVTEWELVTASDDALVYLIAFVSPGLSDSVAESADGLLGRCDPEIGARGATVSFVGSQEAIRDTVAEYESSGVTPDLRKLGSYAGREEPIDALTDRQREVIQTAYDAGYYEVPREATTDDVAAELDLDPSTVAEHLQRAERNLLSRQLSSDP